MASKKIKASIGTHRHAAWMKREQNKFTAIGWFGLALTIKFRPPVPAQSQTTGERAVGIVRQHTPAARRIPSHLRAVKRRENSQT
jgi:hypothetical protein